jgi:hypothetical protein
MGKVLFGIGIEILRSRWNKGRKVEKGVDKVEQKKMGNLTIEPFKSSKRQLS